MDIILILRIMVLCILIITGSRQVVPNYAVPKINANSMSGIHAVNNSLVLKNKSYYAWTALNGSRYAWAVNNGIIGYVQSESLLAENRAPIIGWKWEKQEIFCLHWHRKESVGRIIQQEGSFSDL